MNNEEKVIKRMNEISEDMRRRIDAVYDIIEKKELEEREKMSWWDKLWYRPRSPDYQCLMNSLFIGKIAVLELTIEELQNGQQTNNTPDTHP